MPSLKKMKETMYKLEIAPDIIGQMGLDANQTGKNFHVVFPAIDMMDKLLTKEQRLAVMEREGCCKGGKRDKDSKAFGKEHKDKPLAEKLALMNTVEYMMEPRLNDDGSFTITFSGHQNGVHTGKTTCSCGGIKKLKQPFTVSSTYCGCCAGHFLHHYQNALGVKLQLKEINSSPLNTNGEEPCSFTFETV
ncbi:MAG: hypothetical protein LBI19_02050 [Oscillospiraceae bacterium]|jgi:hypothetical protein|nr:hypothetical protein [Oscillospiraceae bacterium]